MLPVSSALACSVGLLELTWPVPPHLRSGRAAAIAKLTSTLVWRRDNGLADDDGGEGEGGGLTAELIKPENRCGKE